MIFLPFFILTSFFLTLFASVFAERIAQPFVPLPLSWHSEGPPEGWVAGSLLSDVLLCLASTV